MPISPDQWRHLDALRRGTNYRWTLGETHHALWHYIIDTFGFPEWVRSHSHMVSDETAVLPARHMVAKGYFLVGVHKHADYTYPQIYGYLPQDLRNIERVVHASEFRVPLTVDVPPELFL
jgi:hypothetical protein